MGDDIGETQSAASANGDGPEGLLGFGREMGSQEEGRAIGGEIAEGRWVLPILVCLLFLSGSSLWAQSDNAVVPGSTVLLTNTDTNATQTVTAGNDGNFTFAAVPRGNYRVEASHDGFEKAAQNFTLQVSQVQTIEFRLPVGGSTQTIEVTDAAPVVNLATSATGAVIEGKQVTDLPLNGRNFTSLANLIPGVTRGSYNSDASGRNGNVETFRYSDSGGGALSVNGLRGDLRGITQHLDYLQQLGITTVWITPVYQNHEKQSYHGYGATDMYAVDEHFGTLADLSALAAALHTRRMKLVLDTVPNHVGPAHPWVHDSPDPAWFHGTLEHHTTAQGDFAPLTDPHAPWRDQRDVTEGWFANILPDLNQEDPAVAQYLTQNAIWWIEEASLDGLRIDTFPHVGRAFWNSFHTQIHSLYPKLTTVGEVFNADPTITSIFAGGVTRTGMDTGLDTPFDFPAYFALRDVFLNGASMTKLADVLRLDNLFPIPSVLFRSWATTTQPAF